MCVYKNVTCTGLQEIIQVSVLNLHFSPDSMTQQTFNNSTFQCSFFKVLEGNDAFLWLTVIYHSDLGSNVKVNICCLPGSGPQTVM